MLTGLAVQYALFALVSLSTLSHTPERITIESHIFNASVTLLLATAYIIVSALMYRLFLLITHRSSNQNPDIELVYDNIQDDLRDMDPDIDIETCEACKEEEQRLPLPALPAPPPPRRAAPPPPPPSTVASVDVREDSDTVFFLEVYGYGLVMFIIYYSVDMMLLAPALSLLCGLMVLSVRDALQLLRDPASFPEQVVTSKFITFISMLLIFVAIVEMFIASTSLGEKHTLSEVATTSPIYVLLTYVLPVAACLLMGGMRRSCSAHQKIRRAAPLAVLLALFVVLWVLGVDIVASERDHYREAIEVMDGEWHALYDVTDTLPYPAEAELEPDADFEPPPATSQFEYTLFNASIFADPGQFLHDIGCPSRRHVPLLSILVEPLLKLALTFSVITGIVNRKATDTASIIALLTAVKQMHFAQTSFAVEHLVRSIVIAASAALFCAARYVPSLWRCLQGSARG